MKPHIIFVKQFDKVRGLANVVLALSWQVDFDVRTLLPAPSLYPTTLLAPPSYSASLIRQDCQGSDY